MIEEQSEENLAATAAPCLVVVGCSGAGKSTLVRGLRTPSYRHELVVPRRFVTRRERREDDETENSYLDVSRFHMLRRAGRISPCWERTLDNGRQIYYGFESIERSDGRLRVYSANNALLRDKSSSVLSMLVNAMVILVTTDAQCRHARLKQKDMSPAERAVRLADMGDDLLRDDLATEVIDTTHLTPAEGQIALCAVVHQMLDASGLRREVA